MFFLVPENEGKVYKWREAFYQISYSDSNPAVLCYKPIVADYIEDYDGTITIV